MGSKFAETFDLPQDRIARFIEEGVGVYDEIKAKIKRELGEAYFERYSDGPGIMLVGEAALLYTLVRLTSPDHVVETGVAQGASTAMLLSAIDENGGGRLHSIDLPKFADSTRFSYRENDFPIEGFDSAVIPEGKEPGWVVDDRLTENWTLTLGRSQEELVDVLEQLPDIGLFVHDSEHSFQNMLWEMAVAWPNLRQDGWLWVDDAGWNNAFECYACGVDATSDRVGRAGVIRRDV